MQGQWQWLRHVPGRRGGVFRSFVDRDEAGVGRKHLVGQPDAGHLRLNLFFVVFLQRNVAEALQSLAGPQKG